MTPATRTVDDLLAEARRSISRVAPPELDAALCRGALVVDIRPAAQRRLQGELPGSLVVERNVLEWRLDPNSPDRLAQVRHHHQEVVVVCSQGYASSLAAASLASLGFTSAADLDGGYVAWSAWKHEQDGR